MSSWRLEPHGASEGTAASDGPSARTARAPAGRALRAQAAGPGFAGAGGRPRARPWALTPAAGRSRVALRVWEAPFWRAVCPRPRDEARREGGSERRAGGEQSHQWKPGLAGCLCSPGSVNWGGLTARALSLPGLPLGAAQGAPKSGSWVSGWLPSRDREDSELPKGSKQDGPHGLGI